MEHDDLFSVRNSFWLGNFEAAIEEAAAVVPGNDRESIDRDVFMYRSMVELGRAEEVLGKIGDASSVAMDVTAVKMLASYAAQPGSRDAVCETLKEWLGDEMSRDNQVLQLVAGLVLFKSGDVKEALRALRASGNLEISALKVQILLSMNRADLAQRELEAMQGLDDDSTLTQLATAWVNLSSGGAKYQEAAYIFQEQIQKTVASPLLLNGLACCYLQLKQFDDAEKALEEAHSKSPRDAEILANMLSCYAHQNKPPAKLDGVVLKIREVAPAHPLLSQMSACEAGFAKFAAAAH